MSKSDEFEFFLGRFVEFWVGVGIVVGINDGLFVGSLVGTNDGLFVRFMLGWLEGSNDGLVVA